MAEANDEIDQLAERAFQWVGPGDLDRTRVLGILRRAAQHRSEFVHGHEILVAVHLEHAIQQMGEERALDIFERADLVQLPRNIELVNRLRSRDKLLYTCGELADLIASFRGFLEENRGPLLASGLPRSTFPKCPWLERHLARLYYLLIPESSSELGADDRGRPYLSIWENRDRAGERRHDRESGKLHLYPGDAERLAAGREKLLDLKLRVLRRCEQALHEGLTEGLWEDCLAAITTLSRDEAEFYLRLDEFYRGVNATARDICGPEPGMAGFVTLPGGFSDMLDLLGHTECEIRFGANHHTKAELVHVAEQLGFEDWRMVLGESYLAMLECGWLATIDEILNRAWARDADSRPVRFWIDLRKRVNNALQREFDRDVVYRTGIKPKFRGRFELFMQTVGAFAKLTLEETGTLPDLFPGSQGMIFKEQGNSFRRDGKGWFIVYEGKRKHFSGWVGLNYIAHLIRLDGEEISATDLVTRANPRQATSVAAGSDDTPGAADDGTPGEQGDLAAEEDLSIEAVVGREQMINDETLERIRSDLGKLRKRIKRAEHAGKPALVAKLQAEAAQCIGYLRAATDKDGKPRMVGGRLEKDRKSVTAAINYAIRGITRDHKSLAAHLDKCVIRGSFLRYKSDPSTHWNLDL